MDPLQFVVKVPEIRYSDLGIRLYGPETIHVADIERIALGLANLGIDPRFKHFYFNTLALTGAFNPHCHMRLTCVEKIERVLSLAELEETSAYPVKSAGYQIEKYPWKAAAKSADLLQLNRAFHKCDSLDSAWMKKQYFGPPTGHQQIVLVIVRSPGGKIVGFADAILNEPNEEVAMQRNTFVLADHRSLGLGALLKSELVRLIASSTNNQWVIAHNEAENSPMTQISRSLGFHMVQKYKRIEGDL